MKIKYINLWLYQSEKHQNLKEIKEDPIIELRIKTLLKTKSLDSKEEVQNQVWLSIYQFLYV